MKTKKMISFFVTAVIALSSFFSLVACDSTPKAPELTGIEVTTAPTKLSYVLGESFDPTGMVVSKVFDDKSKEALAAADYTYAPAGALKLNDKKITVTYKANDKSFTDTVDIKVTNEIKEVVIVSRPTKESYIAGEVFNPAGMEIKAVLENGDEEEIVAVTPELVTYKTSGLVKSDEHFEMNYGGCSFFLDIAVSHGAFVEAEDGQIAASGASKASQGPDRTAIEKDYANALGNVEDNQGHRGIDKGKKCSDVGITECYKGGCEIDGGRVNERYYVYNHLEWTETTGGHPAKSGMMQENHINFTQGGKMLYRLTADKAGKVTATFKIANPNFDPDNSSAAVETKLSEVLKLTVGTAEVAIPDTVKLAAVDWSEYLAYNRDADFANKGDSDKYTGKKCKPVFYWQNVSVDLTVKQGINDLAVESIWDGDVKLDSISCNADADEITISMKSEFKPVVKTAQIKVADGKVLMGVTVDAQAVNYTDDEVKEFLALTRVASMSSATYSGNAVGGTLDGNTITAADDTNDPWTQPTDRGGLGYETAPPMANLTDSGLLHDYKANMGGKGNAASVEKIADGDYAGCYIVWFDVTISAEDSDNYVGVWTFSSFDYGTAYTASKPDRDIVKTDTNVTTELGGYCYQVYCDSRDDNVTYGWGNLCLVVQKGSFEGDNTCHKLMRRYISHFKDEQNDKELVDLRKENA